MTTTQFLRLTLANVWCELEKESPDIDRCQEIINMALYYTEEYASKKMLYRDGWTFEEYSAEYRLNKG